MLLFWNQTAMGKIMITSPSETSMWFEGETYVIRWKSERRGRICISVLIGGKDAGIINNCKTKASRGKFKWHIPQGFVTGFGIYESARVRVAIASKNDPNNYSISPYFTISGFKPVKTHSYKNTIRVYFHLLSKGEYKTAYYLLNHCKIAAYNCNGTLVLYQPVGRYDSWRYTTAAISRVEILKINRIPYKGNSFCSGKTLLNIKTFKVEVMITRRAEDSEKTLYIDVIKSADGYYHILHIENLY